MKSHKVIGFNASQNPVPEDSTPEEPNANEKIVIRFFKDNYLPVGNRENMEFKTTTELLYELREMVYLSMGAMNKILTGLEYQIQFLEGAPHWVLYSKSQ
jgi:hypothetical protein